MSQEKTEENINPTEGATVASEASLNPAEAINEASQRTDNQKIDDLPIESIGSYARIEESLSDEEAENTSNPNVQS